ncbi:MAG: aldo/keto reductase, partial [Romboutsia sp.]|nr:aldo/keto reductase [Romboutsia sp.]
MEYRKSSKTGVDISLLGFGAMRLISNNGNVDLDLATEQLKYAIDNGINYIDTAYLYGNGSGSNERALGVILDNLGYRDRVFLSTKMNRLVIHSKDDMDRMFENQLDNLKTDHIDYYFLHNIISYEDLMNLINIGLFDFISERKDKGQIINMGFSYHGSFDDFTKIVNEYDWDVTLLQYNYLDNNIQAGLNGIRLAASHNMAGVIMEPLKCGLLAGKMPLEVEDLISNSGTNRINVDLALNWVFDTPEITCVLSGMNSLDMVKENIAIVNNHLENPLNEEEKELI